MNAESVLLKVATNDQIKAVADSFGYTFNDDDCVELRETCAPWNRETETVVDAVSDFLDAFER